MSYTITLCGKCGGKVAPLYLVVSEPTAKKQPCDHCGNVTYCDDYERMEKANDADDG